MNMHDTTTEPTEVLAGPGRHCFILLMLLVVLFSVWVRWRLLQVPLERDEGEFAYMAQHLLQGVPPYRDALTMKWPGTSGMYALSMLMFGQTTVAIHLGLLLVNLASSLLLWLLARRLFCFAGACAAVAAFSLLSVSQGVAGVFAHATHFVVLFVLAGICLLQRFDERDRSWLLFAAGLCFGLAILMKQHAALVALLACAYLWRQMAHRAVGDLPARLFALLMFAGGVALPVVLLFSGMASVGLFETFWFWTVEYASNYAGRLTLAEGMKVFAARLPLLLAVQWPWWLLAAFGALALMFKPQLCRNRLLLSTLLLGSVLAVCPGFYFRNHYFVLPLPAVALLVGASAAAVSRWWIESGRPFRTSILLSLLPVLLAVLLSLWLERSYLLQLSPDLVSRQLYDVNPFPESVEVARYLRENTSPGEKIAILGSEPQLYFYADRPAASRHLYMYGLMETHPHAEAMQREVISEIEAARPGFIVFVNVPTSWLVNPRSVQLLFAWADRYLATYYRLIGRVDIGSDRTDYSFADQPGDLEGSMTAGLLIYRRDSDRR